jgi:glutathione S-transferase
MKLYYSPGACSLSPHIVAREAGIAIDLVKVDNKAKTFEGEGNYLDINSKGYAAALQLDDGSVLTEGLAILQYLGDRAPTSGIVPKAGSMERYRLQEMLGFINSELHKSYSPLFTPGAPEATKEERKAYLRKRYGTVENQLGSSNYLVGGAFSAADASLRGHQLGEDGGGGSLRIS